MLWLYANSLGTILLGCYLATQGDTSFVLTAIVGLFAAGISLPIIALCPVLFGRAFAATDRTIRLLLGGLAVTGLFTLALGIAAMVNTEFNIPASTIIHLSAPYFPAALIAAGFAYKPWLFKHNR